MAFIGGIIIGISSTLNLYIYGRITGLSGVFNSVIKADRKAGFYWKYALVTGMLTTTVPIFLVTDYGVWKTENFEIIFFDPP